MVTLEVGGKSRLNEVSHKVLMEFPLFAAQIQLVLGYFDNLRPIPIFVYLSKWLVCNGTNSHIFSFPDKHI